MIPAGIVYYPYSNSCREGKMARKKGSKNNNTDYTLYYSKLPIEERIEFLARLIVDRIIVDQSSERELLKKIGKKYEQPSTN